MDPHWIDGEETCEDILIDGGSDNDNERDDDIYGIEANGSSTEIQCPYVGMEFETYEDAFSHYNGYARMKGFGTRRTGTRSSQKKELNREIIGRRISCVMEGSHKSKTNEDGKGKRNCATVRMGCKPSMSIKKTKEGKWLVSHFVEEHNHDLTTPSKVRNYRSHRHISVAEAEVIKNMQSSGIRQNLIMSFMENEVGGSQNLSYRRKDINNFLSSKRQKELKNGDAAAVLQYLEAQQVNNPSFFYAIQLDSEGHLTNFFWADARSRIDYHHFGDVVCFDPTYLTNMYGMPFVPIIGINHHFQTIIFGGALLFDETEESFSWVMTTWMKAMDNKQPKVIFTDQESAIGGAISHVMPTSLHRYCAWHIMRNALKNISHVFSKYKGFKNDFSNCLYGGSTVQDFESNWERLLENYNQTENSWLEKLYEKREHWAAAYSHDRFCASMNTTQRSESINFFFDKYLKNDMHLIEFVKQFEQAIKSRRYEESDADFNSNFKKPVLKICMGLEEDAAKVYTREIFSFFQEELISGFSYNHEWVPHDEQTSKFLVWKNNSDASRTVVYDPANQYASCSCKLFEYAGYPCRHILKIFVVVNVQRLPHHFILKRWTKEASGNVVSMGGEIIQADCHEPITCRYGNLCREGINISAKAAVHPKVYEIALKGFHKTLHDVEMALKSVSNASDLPEDNEEASPILDPIMKKRKGRPRKMKSYLDKGGKARGRKSNSTKNTVGSTEPPANSNFSDNNGQRIDAFEVVRAEDTTRSQHPNDLQDTMQTSYFNPNHKSASNHNPDGLSLTTSNNLDPFCNFLSLEIPSGTSNSNHHIDSESV